MKKRQIIQETALNTLKIEHDTIQGLFLQINDSFVASVLCIYETSGRVVITGVGKSAIVGQKIVATLNSTGTPALFMHAADAIHGDLGMIQPNDVVLCISKSGETPEIKALVPMLRHLGNKIIALVSHSQSWLARQADFVMLAPVDKEADPNNLAPTASTTAQAVMGDALATALLALRGFSPQDFAQYHPGGALGKRMYLRVENIYTNNEKPVVAETDDLQKVIVEMTSKRLGCTAVVSDENRIVGIITDGDLRRMLEKETPLKEANAQHIMTAKPLTILAHSLAVNAFDLMRQKSITQLLVVDENEKYLGVIHLHDLIREGFV